MKFIKYTALVICLVSSLGLSEEKKKSDEGESCSATGQLTCSITCNPGEQAICVDGTYDTYNSDGSVSVSGIPGTCRCE